jgi:hypothetical protein
VQEYGRAYGWSTELAGHPTHVVHKISDEWKSRCELTQAFQDIQQIPDKPQPEIAPYPTRPNNTTGNAPWTIMTTRNGQKFFSVSEDDKEYYGRRPFAMPDDDEYFYMSDDDELESENEAPLHQPTDAQPLHPRSPSKENQLEETHQGILLLIEQSNAVLNRIIADSKEKIPLAEQFCELLGCIKASLDLEQKLVGQVRVIQDEERYPPPAVATLRHAYRHQGIPPYRQSDINEMYTQEYGRVETEGPTRIVLQLAVTLLDGSEMHVNALLDSGSIRSRWNC